MKKFKALFTCILFIGTTNTFSQINLGVKAGYTSTLDLSNINSVASGGYDLKKVESEVNTNIHIGGFARFCINKIYLQPELLYNIGKKEYTVTLNDINKQAISYDKFVTISTFDIPILFGYKILDLKLVNIRAYAGPKFRFNAGSSMDIRNATGGSINAANLEENIKQSQIGLETGLGVDVLMFTLDARYCLIQDMYQTKLSNLNIDNIPLSNIIISLGVKF
jgi:hypothetical protein